uniref:Uncharacterized protein n=1 Tax=Schistocephalus solidus TaxID=70667 RepID=A0A0V0J8H4_SCHSO
MHISATHPLLTLLMPISLHIHLPSPPVPDHSTHLHHSTDTAATTPDSTTANTTPATTADFRLTEAGIAHTLHSHRPQPSSSSVIIHSRRLQTDQSSTNVHTGLPLDPHRLEINHFTRIPHHSAAPRTQGNQSLSLHSSHHLSSQCINAKNHHIHYSIESTPPSMIIMHQQQDNETERRRQHDIKSSTLAHLSQLRHPATNPTFVITSILMCQSFVPTDT